MKIFSLIILMFIQIWNGSASADPGDTFHPYISTAFTQDSNLLRLDDEVNIQALTGEKGHSDTIRQLAAGIDIDWKKNKQQFLLDAQVNDNTFNRFNGLDYQGRDTDARWNWQVGKVFKGVLRHTFNRSLAGFEDVRSINGNLRDTERRILEANWLLHPRWQIGLEVSDYSLEYDSNLQQSGDLDEDLYEANLYYMTPKNSRIGFKLQKKEGKYPKRNFGPASVIDNEYEQKSAILILDWQYSGKSSIKIETGYVEREHEHLNQRDYEDINTRASYTWLPRSQLQLKLSIWQQTEPRDDLIASVSQNEGGSVDVVWAATPKITVSGQYKKEIRKDFNDPGFLLVNTKQLREDNDTWALNIQYEPLQSVLITANYTKDKRDSSRALSDFDAHMMNLSAMLKM